MADEIILTIGFDQNSFGAVEKKFNDFIAKVRKDMKVKIDFDTTGFSNRLLTITKALDNFSKNAQKKLTLKVDLVIPPNIAQTLQSVLPVFNQLQQSIAATKASSAQFISQLQNMGQLSKNIMSPQQLAAAKAAATPGTVFTKLQGAIAGVQYQLGALTSQSFFGFVTAAAAGSAKIKSLVKDFAAFETQMISIGRLTQLTGSSLTKMGEDLTGISTRLGVSTMDVLKLAEAAAKLGVSSKDLMPFVEGTQKVAIALQMSGEEAANSFRSLTLLFQLPITKIVNIADGFNAVADSSAIAASSLVTFVQYVAPAFNQFQIFGERGVAAATALGAVMGELGVSAEVTGSGISRIMKAIQTNIVQAARIAGVEIERFKEIVEVDMLKAMQLLLEGFGKMDAASRIAAASMLKLNDIRVSRVLNLLANNVEQFAAKQEIANKNIRDGISVEREAQRQAASLTSQFVQLTNVVDSLLREVLMPYVETIKHYIFVIRQAIRDNPELIKQWLEWALQITAVVTAFGLLFGALFVVTQILNPLLSLISTLIGMMGWFTKNMGKILFHIQRYGWIMWDSVAGGTKAAWDALKLLSGQLLKYAGMLKQLVTQQTLSAAATISLANAQKALAAAFVLVRTSILKAVAAAWAFAAPFLKLAVVVAALIGAIELFRKYVLGTKDEDMMLHGEMKKLTDSMNGVGDSSEKTVNYLRQYSDAAKDAAKSTDTFIESVAVVENSFAGMSADTDRAIAAMSSFEQASENFDAIFQDFGKKGKDIFKDAKIASWIAPLFEQGGEPIRLAFNDMIDRALKIDPEKGAKTAAAAVQDVIDQINITVKQAFNQQPFLGLKVDENNLAEAQKKISDTVKAITEKAKAGFGDAEIEARAISFLIADVVNNQSRALGSGIIDLAKYKNAFKLIQDELRYTSSETNAFVKMIQDSGIAVEDFFTNKNIKTFATLFGFEDLAKFREFFSDIDKFKNDLAGLTKYDLVNVLDLTNAQTIMKSFLQMTSEGKNRIIDLVGQLKEKGELEKTIAEFTVKAEDAERERIGNMKDERDLAVKTLLVVQKRIKAELNLTATKIKALEDEKVLKKAIEDLDEKIGKKEKESTQAVRDREKEENVLLGLAKRQIELRKEIADKLDDIPGVLQTILEKEMAVVEEFKKEKHTIDGLIKAQTDGLRNAAIAQVNFLKKSVEGLKKDIEKAAKEVQALEDKGEDFIRKELRALNPNKDLEELQDYIYEFHKAAAEGIFGKTSPEDVKKLFSDRLKQIMGKQDKDRQEAALKLEEERFDVQRDMEGQLLDYRKKGREKIDEEAEYKSVLEATGSAQQAAQAVADMREERQRSFEDANIALDKNAARVDQINAEIAKIQGTSNQNSRRMQDLIKEATMGLDRFMQVGQGKYDELKNAYKEISLRLDHSAYLLMLAAARWREVFSAAEQKRIAEGVKQEKAGEIKGEIVGLEGTKTSFVRFGQAIRDDFVGPLNALRKQFDSIDIAYVKAAKVTQGLTNSIAIKKAKEETLKGELAGAELAPEAEAIKKVALQNTEAVRASDELALKSYAEKNSFYQEAAKQFKDEKEVLKHKFMKKLEEIFPGDEDMRKKFEKQMDKVLDATIIDPQKTQLSNIQKVMNDFGTAFTNEMTLVEQAIKAKTEEMKKILGGVTLRETAPGATTPTTTTTANIGYPIDMTRPIVLNPEGGFSTERTDTWEMVIDNKIKHVLIPTIVNGVQKSSEEALKLWKEGINKEVGIFNTAQEAEAAAVARTAEIEKRRGEEVKKLMEEEKVQAIKKAAADKAAADAKRLEDSESLDVSLTLEQMYNRAKKEFDYYSKQSKEDPENKITKEVADYWKQNMDKAYFDMRQDRAKNEVTEYDIGQRLSAQANMVKGAYDTMYQRLREGVKPFTAAEIGVRREGDLNRINFGFNKIFEDAFQKVFQNPAVIKSFQRMVQMGFQQQAALNRDTDALTQAFFGTSFAPEKNLNMKSKSTYQTGLGFFMGMGPAVSNKDLAGYRGMQPQVSMPSVSDTLTSLSDRASETGEKVGGMTDAIIGFAESSNNTLSNLSGVVETHTEYLVRLTEENKALQEEIARAGAALKTVPQ